VPGYPVAALPRPTRLMQFLPRAGGGAVEAALSVYLEAFATTLGSREQLAIAEAADALLVIPKTLAVNAAKDATELARPALKRRRPRGILPRGRPNVFRRSRLTQRTLHVITIIAWAGAGSGQGDACPDP